MKDTEFRTHWKSLKINSQSGQDAYVSDYFNNKKNGFFLDIGANDGISLSNTYYLEKSLNWNGICFEPIPSTFEKLNQNRNCIKLMVGVSDENSTETFMYMEPSSKMLSGMKKEYHPKHIDRIESQLVNGSKLMEVDIECVLFNEIMEYYNIKRIDYLNIDTEGNELKIVKSINFEKYDIEIMTIENNYKDEEQTKYILSKGYQLIGTLGGDEVFKKIY